MGTSDGAERPGLPLDADIVFAATATFQARPHSGAEGRPERHMVVVTRNDERYRLLVGHAFGVLQIAGSESLPALMMALARHGEDPHPHGSVFGTSDDREAFGIELAKSEGRVARTGNYAGTYPVTVFELEIGSTVLAVEAVGGRFRLSTLFHPRMTLCDSAEPEAVLRATALLVEARTDRDRLMLAEGLGRVAAAVEREIAERPPRYASAPTP